MVEVRLSYSFTLASFVDYQFVDFGYQFVAYQKSAHPLKCQNIYTYIKCCGSGPFSRIRIRSNIPDPTIKSKEVNLISYIDIFVKKEGGHV